MICDVAMEAALQHHVNINQDHAGGDLEAVSIIILIY